MPTTLTKIISGGQTGADQAALKYNFPHGGWIPKGRLAESGRLPDRYKLSEMPTKSYPKRTQQNIFDSDGTLVISREVRLTGGSKLTRDYAETQRRPFLHVNLANTARSGAASIIYAWIGMHEVGILNVAGPRASKDENIYDDVKEIIQGVLQLTAVNARPGAKLGEYAEEHFRECLPFRQPDWL